MKSPPLPLFDAPNLMAQLVGMSDDELDALPYGVIEMDQRYTVLRYSATESRNSHLPADRVIGRHFFRDVAYCADNRHVAHRYEEGTLDATIPYVFAFRMKLEPVTLRMLRGVGQEKMYLLIRRP